MRNCGNCADARKHGIGSQVYCRFYGIPISRNYDRCHRQRPVIIEVENEIINKESERDIRREGDSRAG